MEGVIDLVNGGEEEENLVGVAVAVVRNVAAEATRRAQEEGHPGKQQQQMLVGGVVEEEEEEEENDKEEGVGVTTVAVAAAAVDSAGISRRRTISRLRREEVATPLQQWSPPKPTVSMWSMEVSPSKKHRRRKFPLPFSTVYGHQVGSDNKQGSGAFDGVEGPWRRPASASAAIGGSGVAVARAAKQQAGDLLRFPGKEGLAAPQAGRGTTQVPSTPPLPNGIGPSRGEWGCPHPSPLQLMAGGLQNPAVAAPHGPQLLRAEWPETPRAPYANDLDPVTQRPRKATKTGATERLRRAARAARAEVSVAWHDRHYELWAEAQAALDALAEGQRDEVAASQRELREMRSKLRGTLRFSGRVLDLIAHEATRSAAARRHVRSAEKRREEGGAQRPIEGDCADGGNKGAAPDAPRLDAARKRRGVEVKCGALAGEIVETRRRHDHRVQDRDLLWREHTTLAALAQRHQLAVAVLLERAGCENRRLVAARDVCLEALDRHVLNAVAVISHAEQLDDNMDSQISATGMAADALRMAQHRSASVLYQVRGHCGRAVREARDFQFTVNHRVMYAKAFRAAAHKRRKHRGVPNVASTKGAAFGGGASSAARGCRPASGNKMAKGLARDRRHQATRQQATRLRSQLQQGGDSADVAASEVMPVERPSSAPNLRSGQWAREHEVRVEGVDEDEGADGSEEEDYEEDYEGDSESGPRIAEGTPLRRAELDYSMDFIPENAGKPLRRLRTAYSMDFVPETAEEKAAAERGGIISSGSPIKADKTNGGQERARSRSPPREKMQASRYEHPDGNDLEANTDVCTNDLRKADSQGAASAEKHKKPPKKTRGEKVGVQQQTDLLLSEKQESALFVKEAVFNALPAHQRRAAMAGNGADAKMRESEDIYAENKYGQQAGGAALGTFARPRRKPALASKKRAGSTVATHGRKLPSKRVGRSTGGCVQTQLAETAPLAMCDWCQQQTPCVSIPHEWVGGGYGRFCGWECAKVWNQKYSPVSYRHTRDIMIDIEAGKLVRAASTKEGARRGNCRKPWKPAI